MPIIFQPVWPDSWLRRSARYQERALQKLLEIHTNQTTSQIDEGQNGTKSDSEERTNTLSKRGETCFETKHNCEVQSSNTTQSEITEKQERESSAKHSQNEYKYENGMVEERNINGGKGKNKNPTKAKGKKNVKSVTSLRATLQHLSVINGVEASTIPIHADNTVNDLRTASKEETADKTVNHEEDKISNAELLKRLSKLKEKQKVEPVVALERLDTLCALEKQKSKFNKLGIVEEKLRATKTQSSNELRRNTSKKSQKMEIDNDLANDTKTETEEKIVDLEEFKRTHEYCAQTTKRDCKDKLGESTELKFVDSKINIFDLFANTKLESSLDEKIEEKKEAVKAENLPDNTGIQNLFKKLKGISFTSVSKEIKKVKDEEGSWRKVEDIGFVKESKEIKGVEAEKESCKKMEGIGFVKVSKEIKRVESEKKSCKKVEDIGFVKESKEIKEVEAEKGSCKKVENTMKSKQGNQQRNVDASKTAQDSNGKDVRDTNDLFSVLKCEVQMFKSALSETVHEVNEKVKSGKDEEVEKCDEHKIVEIETDDTASKFSEQRSCYSNESICTQKHTIINDQNDGKHDKADNISPNVPHDINLKRHNSCQSDFHIAKKQKLTAGRMKRRMNRCGTYSRRLAAYRRERNKQECAQLMGMKFKWDYSKKPNSPPMKPMQVALRIPIVQHNITILHATNVSNEKCTTMVTDPCESFINLTKSNSEPRVQYSSDGEIAKSLSNPSHLSPNLALCVNRTEISRTAILLSDACESLRSTDSMCSVGAEGGELNAKSYSNIKRSCDGVSIVEGETQDVYQPQFTSDRSVNDIATVIKKKPEDKNFPLSSLLTLPSTATISSDTMDLGIVKTEPLDENDNISVPSQISPLHPLIASTNSATENSIPNATSTAIKKETNNFDTDIQNHPTSSLVIGEICSLAFTETSSGMATSNCRTDGAKLVKDEPCDQSSRNRALLPTLCFEADSVARYLKHSCAKESRPVIRNGFLYLHDDCVTSGAEDSDSDNDEGINSTTVNDDVNHTCTNGIEYINIEPDSKMELEENIRGKREPATLSLHAKNDYSLHAAVLGHKTENQADNHAWSNYMRGDVASGVSMKVQGLGPEFSFGKTPDTSGCEKGYPDSGIDCATLGTSHSKEVNEVRNKEEEPISRHLYDIAGTLIDKYKDNIDSYLKKLLTEGKHGRDSLCRDLPLNDHGKIRGNLGQFAQTTYRSKIFNTESISLAAENGYPSARNLPSTSQETCKLNVCGVDYYSTPQDVSVAKVSEVGGCDIVGSTDAGDFEVSSEIDYDLSTCYGACSTGQRLLTIGIPGFGNVRCKVSVKDVNSEEGNLPEILGTWPELQWLVKFLHSYCDNSKLGDTTSSSSNHERSTSGVKSRRKQTLTPRSIDFESVMSNEVSMPESSIVSQHESRQDEGNQVLIDFLNSPVHPRTESLKGNPQQTKSNTTSDSEEYHLEDVWVDVETIDDVEYFPLAVQKQELNMEKFPLSFHVYAKRNLNKPSRKTIKKKRPVMRNKNCSLGKYMASYHQYKMQFRGGKKYAHHRKRNYSLESSFSTDSSVCDPQDERAIRHNHLQRERRQAQSEDFIGLRNVIPKIACKKAPKVTILKSAVERIDDLKREEKSLLEHLNYQKSLNRVLELKLNRLREGQNPAVRSMDFTEEDSSPMDAQIDQLDSLFFVQDPFHSHLLIYN